jgi:hypothetical protein
MHSDLRQQSACRYLRHLAGRQWSPCSSRFVAVLRTIQPSDHLIIKSLVVTRIISEEWRRTKSSIFKSIILLWFYVCSWFCFAPYQCFTSDVAGRTCERYRDAEDCRIGRRLACPTLTARAPLAPDHTAQLTIRDDPVSRPPVPPLHSMATLNNRQSAGLSRCLNPKASCRRLVGHYEGDGFVVDMIKTTTPSRHAARHQPQLPRPVSSRGGGLTAIGVIADK